MPTNQELYGIIKEQGKRIKKLEDAKGLGSNAVLTAQEVLNLAYHLNNGNFQLIKRDLFPKLLKKCGLVIDKYRGGIFEIETPVITEAEVVFKDETTEEDETEEIEGDEEGWLGKT